MSLVALAAIAWGVIFFLNKVLAFLITTAKEVESSNSAAPQRLAKHIDILSQLVSLDIVLRTMWWAALPLALGVTGGILPESARADVQRFIAPKDVIVLCVALAFAQFSAFRRLKSLWKTHLKKFFSDRFAKGRG